MIDENDIRQLIPLICDNDDHVCARRSCRNIASAYPQFTDLIKQLYEDYFEQQVRF